MKLLYAIVLVLAIAPASQDRSPDLLELPEVDLTGVDSRIQDILYERRDLVLGLSAHTETNATELASAYAELGKAAMIYELVELTEACFQNAVRLDPENPHWYYYLGVVYQSLLRLDEAASALERSLDLKSENPSAEYRLAEIELQRGNLTRSSELFGASITRPGWAAADLYGLGRVAAAQSDWRSAIDYLQNALDYQSDVAEIRHQLGMAYRELGDLDAARKYLSMSEEATGILFFPDPLIESLSAELSRSSIYVGSKAFEAGRFVEAAEHYKSAVDSDPENATYHQALASALTSLGDLDGAVEEHRAAVQLAPGDAMAQVQLATALIERDGVTDDVISHFKTAIELAPDLQEALMGLANSYSLRGRSTDALGLLDRVLELDPNDTYARYARAQVLLALGSNQEAIVDLETLLASNPHNLEASLDLSTLLVRSGMLEEAVELLESSLKLEWEPAGRALLVFNAGVIWQQMGEDDRAIASYRLALDDAADFGDAHFNLAALLGSQGDTDGAVHHLRQVVEIDPQDREAHAALASALIQMGRFAEGRAALEKGHENLPDDIQLTRALVQVLVASPDRAVRDPQAALPLAVEVQNAQPDLENTAWVVAALAGAGRFEEAFEWQRQVVTKAEQAGVPEQQLQRFRAELERFRQLKESGE